MRVTAFVVTDRIETFLVLPPKIKSNQIAKHPRIQSEASNPSDALLELIYMCFERTESKSRVPEGSVAGLLVFARAKSCC